MIAELICVGTELLMGQVLNTNAQFIAQELAPSGIDMYHQQMLMSVMTEKAVKDNRARFY